MPFFSSAMPFFSQRHAHFLKLHKMPYILVKKHDNLTKTKEVTVFFQFEAWSSKEDTCCYNSLLRVNPFTMVTNYLRQFWHITLMTIPQLASI